MTTPCRSTARPEPYVSKTIGAPLEPDCRGARGAPSNILPARKLTVSPGRSFARFTRATVLQGFCGEFPEA